MLAKEHDVTVVTSAQEALDRITLANEGFELILCDLLMPQTTGMDFYELLQIVAPELVQRVIFITGGGFTPRARAFLAQPFIHRIEKPFPPLPELRQAVLDHIRRIGKHE